MRRRIGAVVATGTLIVLGLAGCGGGGGHEASPATTSTTTVASTTTTRATTTTTTASTTTSTTVAPVTTTIRHPVTPVTAAPATTRVTKPTPVAPSYPVLEVSAGTGGTDTVFAHLGQAIDVHSPFTDSLLHITNHGIVDNSYRADCQPTICTPLTAVGIGTTTMVLQPICLNPAALCQTGPEIDVTVSR